MALQVPGVPSNMMPRSRARGLDSPIAIERQQTTLTANAKMYEQSILILISHFQKKGVQHSVRFKLIESFDRVMSILIVRESSVELESGD
jgi:hypothetical protein